MKIFNTMTKKKEEFIPLEEGKVKIALKPYKAVAMRT